MNEVVRTEVVLKHYFISFDGNEFTTDEECILYEGEKILDETSYTVSTPFGDMTCLSFDNEDQYDIYKTYMIYNGYYTLLDANEGSIPVSKFPAYFIESCSSGIAEQVTKSELNAFIKHFKGGKKGLGL